MKTTVEISDALFHRARRVTEQRGITFRALIEESLQKNLKHQSKTPFKLRRRPFTGEGIRPGLGWAAIREEIYKGRGE